MSRRITGKVLVAPARDPKEAFLREIAAALAAGEEQQAYGLCIGLSLLWCQPMEDIWHDALTRRNAAAFTAFELESIL